MSLRRVMVFLLIPAAPLLAQFVNNTVTMTASKSATAQPDEAVFSVVVGSGLDKSLDDAVAAVSGLGISAANLVQTNTLLPAARTSPTAPPPMLTLNWTFQLVVPLAKSKDTTSALAALQNSISQSNSGLTLSFILSGTLVFAQQTPNCNLTNLVSQARGQAQDTAGAAGFKAGAIVGLTSSNAAPLCSLTKYSSASPCSHPRQPAWTTSPVLSPQPEFRARISLVFIRLTFIRRRTTCRPLSSGLSL